MRINLARLTVLFSIAATALLSLAPAALADVEGEFLGPGDGAVVSGNSTLLSASIGPVEADGGEFRFGSAGAALANCDQASITFLPEDPMIGPYPPYTHMLTCSWDTSLLAEGPYSIALMVNNVTLQHVVGSDITITIDRTNPSTPSGVTDDRVPPTGSDRDQLGSGDVAVSWTIGADTNLASQNVCITTVLGDCTGAIRSTTINNDLATSATLTGTALVNGTTYYSCVRSVDAAGNAGAYGCSDGFTVDAVAPATLTGVAEDTQPGSGSDLDLMLASGPTTITWDENASNSYEWCINDTLDCATPARSGSTVTSPAFSSTPDLTDGYYYTCVRALDGVGNASAYACTDGFLVDTLAPTDPTGVSQTVDAAAGTATISWTAATDTNGIKNYDWCFNTAANCTGALRSGTTSGTSVPTTGTALAYGTYYSCVTARDNADRTSATACSAVFTHAAPPAPVVQTPVTQNPPTNDEDDKDDENTAPACGKSTVKASAPNSVKKGAKASVKVKWVAGNCNVVGKVTVVVKGKGFSFSKTVKYSGGTVTVNTAKLKKAGTYKVTVKADAVAGSGITDAKTTDTIKVK